MFKFGQRYWIRRIHPSALRQARAASEVRTSATASQAQAAQAASAYSMSASRQQASSQQAELDEVLAASERARVRILELEREMQHIKVLEDVAKKAKQVNALGGTGYIENITGALLLNF